MKEGEDLKKSEGVKLGIVNIDISLWISVTKVGKVLQILAIQVSIHATTSSFHSHISTNFPNSENHNNHQAAQDST